MRKCGKEHTLANEYTFSFFSVSSLSEADRDSRVSPGGVDEAPLGLIIDCLRAGELREEETREAAERAVAPLAIEEEGGGVEPGGDRREAGVALAGAVVAIMGYRQRAVCCAGRMMTGSLPPWCRNEERE